MSVKVILLFCLGILYGLGIGFIGQKIVTSAVMKVQPRNDREVVLMKRRVMIRWWLRFLLEAVALFVLFKVRPMLLGAALGILLMSKLFIVRTIRKSNSQ